MKILSSGIIVFVIGALLVAGLASQKNQTPPVSHLKLEDRCPNQKRDPFAKTQAQITRMKGDLAVQHQSLGFQFLISEGGFRFEENTLQDYEEPIALPLYLYTMYLTFPETRDIHRDLPVEIKFLVYPDLCNTPDDWVAFFARQGWSRIPGDEMYPLFTVIEKQQSGRIYRRYFRHYGDRHYEFELSWDISSPLFEEGLRKAGVILGSFRLIHEKESL